MKLHFTLLLLIFITFTGFSQPDEKRIKEVRQQMEKLDTTGWQYGLGIGLDFLQLLQINPRVGSGEDRIQVGAVSTFFADYTDDKLSWSNNGSLLFGIQRLGSGLTTIGGQTQRQPFQKTVDELRLVSNVAYKTSENSVWAYSAALTFISQITPTYRGNYLSDVTETGMGPIAKFLNPAQITFAPGIQHQPNQHFSLLFSPASLKAIIVPDDDIASIPGDSALMVGLHGTEWKSRTNYSNALYQFGASVRALYKNKYWNDRFIHRSELTLFSNYLNQPQNIDVDFRNEFAIELFKGLQLSLIVNMLYDHDIPVQKTDFDEPGGVATNPDGTVKLTRALSIIQTFTVKYNYIF